MNGCAVFPVIDLPMTGRNIARLRKEAGVTVRELQDYFGFEYPQAIYKWQHGECLPSVDNLLALSRVLRVPMEDLLVYDDREVPIFLAGLNYRFNDKPVRIVYPLCIDREHGVPTEEVGQGIDFRERGFSCRIPAHTAALSGNASGA